MNPTHLRAALALVETIAMCRKPAVVAQAFRAVADQLEGIATAPPATSRGVRLGQLLHGICVGLGTK
jgi:hypothetical protein